MSSHILGLLGIRDPKAKILQHFGCAGTAAKPSLSPSSVTADSSKAGNQVARPFNHR